MKRTLIVFIAVLLLVSASVYALNEEYWPDSVQATLKATLDQYLVHGFILDDPGYYYPAISISNAFVTDPKFTYGYKTNAPGTYKFTMKVTNFVNSSVEDVDAIIKIGDIKFNGYSQTFNLGATEHTFTLFNDSVSTYLGSESTSNKVEITILPAREAVPGKVNSYEHIGLNNNAWAGDYVATITFTVTKN